MDKKDVEKLCNIWEKWHLNNMRPYCSHQKDLGWERLAGKNITTYVYKLNRENILLTSETEKKMMEVLKNGETVTPTSEEVKLLNLKYSVEIFHELTEGDELYPFYRLERTEQKILGWVYPEEHSEGLLTKPCPVCGYKYGTSWIKEEVPEDVLEWLFNLPETKIQPAWN